MQWNVPRSVRPSAVAERLREELAAAGWAIARDAAIRLVREVGSAGIQIAIVDDPDAALAAVEAGAIDALVWPGERDRLPRALMSARRAAAERARCLAYQRVFRANPEWLEITTSDAVILDVSAGFEDITGYSRGEAIGRTPAELFRAGTHGSEFYEGVIETLHEQGVWRGDLVGRRRNGSWAILDATIGLVRDAGRPIAHFAIKRGPAHHSATGLRDRVAEATTAPWVLLGPTGTVLDHDASAPRVLGRDRLLGVDAIELGLVASGDVWVGTRAFEVRPVLLQAGDIPMQLLVLHDITERKHHVEQLDALARDLAQARDQALAADQAKSAFLASMSHELRTPLNAILGYAELLLETANQPETTGDLSRIREAGRHLLDLVDDVLDLARVEAGIIDVHEGTVDVLDLLREAADGVRLRAAARGQHVEIRGEGGRIRSDRRLLRQILLNLLGNATKYAVPGRITVGIDWTDLPTLFVEDEGPGLDEVQMHNIFQPFVQYGAPASGVGLGLAISRRLAGALRAELTVQSRPGAGTRFLLRLPAQASG